MHAIDCQADLRAFLRGLSSDAARAHGVPAAVAERACAATLRKFTGLAGAAPSHVRSYFWGVVRGTALSARGDTRALRVRYLAAALAQDLLSAGHPRERVREEVARTFGPDLPAGALASIGR